jgi:hypothetical protein
VELYIRVPERWCQEIAHAGRAHVEIVHSFLAKVYTYLPAVLQPRPARLPQAKSEALASHQAARFLLAPELCLLPLVYYLNDSGGYDVARIPWD